MAGSVAPGLGETLMITIERSPLDTSGKIHYLTKDNINEFLTKVVDTSIAPKGGMFSFSAPPRYFGIPMLQEVLMAVYELLLQVHTDYSNGTFDSIHMLQIFVAKKYDKTILLEFLDEDKEKKIPAAVKKGLSDFYTSLKLEIEKDIRGAQERGRRALAMSMPAPPKNTSLQRRLEILRRGGGTRRSNRNNKSKSRRASRKSPTNRRASRRRQTRNRV